MKRASGSHLKSGKRAVARGGTNPFAGVALAGSERTDGQAPPVLLATVEQCTAEIVGSAEETGVEEPTQGMVLRSRKCSVVVTETSLPACHCTGATSLLTSTEPSAPRRTSPRVSERCLPGTLTLCQTAVTQSAAHDSPKVSERCLPGTLTLCQTAVTQSAAHDSLRVSECQAGLLSAAEKLTSDLKLLHFKDPVSCVYNPLEYAWEPFRSYILTYGGRPGVVLLLGMNPGPFGMVQTGVPFGDVRMCSEYLQISGTVSAPPTVHPQRPINGFHCKRTEVSGTRLWGWARRRYPDPHAFFDKFFIHNYCPLAFMETSGKNRTPDRLPPAERAALLGACDQALKRVFELLQPSLIVGIGKYSAERARKCAPVEMTVGAVLHPSPANPTANKAWESIFESQLEAMRVEL